MEKLKIVFMGTPDFAVTILDSIVQANYDVAAVITAPDKPAGRGRKISQSAVKEFALSHNLNILQPTNLKDELFQAELRSIQADLFVVVAFRMLPETVWAMPPKGTINLHGSLLPNYRGAAPINWAIINGEKETGVTTFFIEKEIDTGKIIDTDTILISANMTAGDLHDDLAALGAKTMLHTLEKIQNNQAFGKEQSSFDLENIKNAPKIFKEDCLVNWNQPAAKVHDFIRGLSPYPAAWCYLQKETTKMTCKLFGSEISEKSILQAAKYKIIADSDVLLFPCSDKFLLIKEIQLEGKRRMSVKEFCAGNRIEDFKLVEKTE
ncbi:MAG: methionyl-tRNA formyltransferase [Crocinitomicaceae bacterium]